MMRGLSIVNCTNWCMLHVMTISIVKAPMINAIPAQTISICCMPVNIMIAIITLEPAAYGPAKEIVFRLT